MTSPILTINCNSIKTKKRQLALAQYLVPITPSFVLLQETRLGDYTPRIGPYTLVSTPSTIQRSIVGTALLVSPGVQYEPVAINITNVEGTFVSLTHSTRKTLVGSIYINCKLSATEVRTAISTLVSRLLTYDMFVIGGDFNSDCRTTKNSARAEAIRTAVLPHAHVSLIMPTKSTFRSGSILDGFIVGDHLGEMNKAIVKTTNPFSDHSGVTLTPVSGLSDFFNLMPARTRIECENINWSDFNGYIEAELLKTRSAPIVNSHSIDKEIARITSIINTAINIFLTQSTTTASSTKTLTPEARVLFKDRAKLLKAKFNEQKKILSNKTMINFFNEELGKVDGRLDELLKSIASASMRNRLIHIKPGPKMFPQINKICSRGKFQRVRALINSQGTELIADKDILEEFKNFYAELYTAKPPPHPLRPQRPNRCSPFPVNLQSVIEIIKSINNKKSAGPDRISNFIIKKLSTTVLLKISYIFHKCVDLQYFPGAWKVARVIVLPKSKGAKETANFRPISLVSCLGKILERIILNKLQEEVEKHNILPKYQTGFRKAHSTMDAAALLRDTIVGAFAIKWKVAACLLDIRKAFDSVWRDGLIFKLRKFGISENIVKLMGSFTENRWARIHLNGSDSERFAIERGVPQGTVLGPVLYNIFLSDQPKAGRNEGLLQYADDTACLGLSRRSTQAVKKVQGIVKRMEQYYSKWGLKINGKKSELILFNLGNSKEKFKILVDGIEVPEKNSIRYLGITFTKRLNNTAAMKSRKNLGNTTLAKLRRILRSEFLNKRVKLLMYKQLIRPVITYGSPIWASNKNNAWASITAIETKALRVILNMEYNRATGKMPQNEIIYEESGITPLMDVITDINEKFVNRYINHKNKWIKSKATTALTKRRSGKGPKLKLTRESAMLSSCK